MIRFVFQKDPAGCCMKSQGERETSWSLSHPREKWLWSELDIDILTVMN